MSDSKSIEAALTEHAPFIENLARKLVGDRDRAADLVQEAMVAALRSPEAVKSSGARRWLSVVMRRSSASQRRRDGLHAASSLAPNSDHEGGIYDLSVNTDSDGRFVLKVDDSAPYTITHTPAERSFRSSALENVTAPAQNLELRLDALLFRPTLPADLDPAALEGSGGTIAPFGVPMDKAPFKMSTRGATV